MTPAQYEAAMTRSILRAQEQTQRAKGLGRWPLQPERPAKESRRPSKPRAYREKDRRTNTLGGRITQLRHIKGYSQNDLAEIINAKQTAISFWERGKCSPRPENIQLLAEAFGVTPGYLTEGK